jgi:hypothetical protein
MAVLFASACGSPEPQADDEAGLTTFGGDELDDGSKDDESGAPKFDLGGASEETGANPEGSDEICSKVDVVLAVDASSSMNAEIATLPATFVLMKDTLATKVGNGITDFRIGVINACPNPAFFHDWAADGVDCNFPANRNWLASDDPQLDEQFACVVDFPLQDEALAEKGGQNGGYGNQPDLCSDSEDEDEQPAWTAAQAVQPGVMQNLEFVRSDAILFVIAITDEDEEFADVPDAEGIRTAMLLAKGGVENDVTFLGIGGEDCPSAYDGSDVDDSERLRQTAEAFGERGLFRTMCEGQGPDPIAAAFEEALTTIVDAACDDYVPQG